MRWVGVIVLSLFIGGELVSRYYLGLGDPPLSIADEKTEYRFKPGTYHRFGNTITFNTFSMRSGPVTLKKEDPHQLRVLMIGDSVINGGAMTDDRKLASKLLQDRLSDELKVPVYVGNISAGSWGPPNQAGYLQKFGWFDADVMVLVLSSHDAADTPSFERIIDVHPSYPSQKPALAIVELFSRYSPLRKWFSGQRGNPFEQLYASSSDQILEVRKEICRKSIAWMLEEAQSRGIVPAIVIHPHKPEIKGPIYPERGILTGEAARTQTTLIDLTAAMQKANETGTDPYRENDDIHLSDSGQEVLADAIYPHLMQILENRRKK